MTARDAPTERHECDDVDPDVAAPCADEEHSTSGLSLQIVDSIQIILTALMLAFMLRAFFIEAFIIPTGSMAPGLLGRHAVQVCPNCGLQFDYGPAGSLDGFTPPNQTFCPNCHVQIEVQPEKVGVRSGDRILVHKWPYVLGGFLAPKRWDVFVFRDPADPSQNFIKRVVALPNESIEVVDGDLYIMAPGASEHHIARKTRAAQSMLWFNVFNQNFLPRDNTAPDHPPAWVAERNAAGRQNVGWSNMHLRVIRHDASDDTVHALRFDPDGSRYYMQDVYAYNHGSGGNYVGDVRILTEMHPLGGDGWLQFQINRDGDSFKARIHADGEAVLSATRADQASSELEIGTATVAPLAGARPCIIEFGHLDYRVYLKIDGRVILATDDQQYSPNLSVLRTTHRIKPVEIRLSASNLTFELSGLRVDRDVHYAYSRSNTLRAYPSHPFALGDDEYFAMGDNSPNSHDSREWFQVGPHLEHALKADEYQVGAVRANQIVGRAFFVYLPSLLPISEESRWRIPDLGRVRFIR